MNLKTVNQTIIQRILFSEILEDIRIKYLSVVFGGMGKFAKNAGNSLASFQYNACMGLSLRVKLAGTLSKNLANRPCDSVRAKLGYIGRFGPNLGSCDNDS
jgi:hypothetical protein